MQRKRKHTKGHFNFQTEKYTCHWPSPTFKQFLVNREGQDLYTSYSKQPDSMTFTPVLPRKVLVL